MIDGISARAATVSTDLEDEDLWTFSEDAQQQFASYTSTPLDASSRHLRRTVQIAVRRPDYLLILPWNIAPEVMEQEARIREWGARFVTAVPELKIR